MKKIVSKLKIIFTSMILFCTCGNMNVYAMAANTDGDFMEKFNAFIQEYEVAVTIGLSVLLLLAMLTFIYHVVKLTQAADNPQQRKEAINNLLICGACLAVQGSISLFIMLYFYLLN